MTTTPTIMMMTLLLMITFSFSCKKINVLDFLFQISMNIKAQTNAMKMPTVSTPMDLIRVPVNKDSLEMGQPAQVWLFYFSFYVYLDLRTRLLADNVS